MPRRILFAIRSKLGDTLINYQCVRAFADTHPGDSVTLLTRTDYAKLLTGEPGLRVIGFNSRIAMTLRLLWMRLAEPAFDVLAVLWGSGPPIARIGRLVNARRKIAWTGKFAPDLFEEASLPPDYKLVDPALNTIRVFEPSFEAPRALDIRSLASRYRNGAHTTPRLAIGIVPVADEVRRNLDPATLAQLVGALRRDHPGAPLRVFVNPGNAGSDALTSATLPSGCELRTFRDLTDLVEQYMDLAAWFGTDTGLYHLAAAIGIPTTVFFGPTQPRKIVLPAQRNARVFRLAGLGNSHCDEKSCVRPLCLHANVSAWCNVTTATRLDETPAACPLRALPPSALTQLHDMSPITA